MDLNNKRVVITGASRGIGAAIAVKLANAGAKVALLAKTSEPHAKLPGTIHTVAQSITDAGGHALALQVDVRDEDALNLAIKTAADHFSGLDVLINNASAISLTPSLETPMKRFDLMMAVNMRATFAASQAALPYLIHGNNPHILNMSPPLNMASQWFKDHVAYTMSKYGMSMCTLGMAAEFQGQVAVNSLWPKTAIATAAIKYNFPDAVYQASRKPAIVADAALAILQRNANTCSGHFFIDEDVLRETGITDFAPYAVNPNASLFTDLFVDEV